MSESTVDAFRAAVQESLRNDTWLEGNRVRHSLRGYFNMLLIPRAEYADLQYKPDIADAVVREFKRYVAAPHAGEPTPDEIASFAGSIADEDVRGIVGNMLAANLRELDKYRP